MYLLGNRFHTDSFFQFKSEVTFKQLLAMATYNHTFAGVLMDMRKTAQQKFSELNCTVEDAANAGETVPVILDFDDEADKIEYENEFGGILFSAAPEFYRNAVEKLAEFSPWLNSAVMGEVLGSILSICHLENILEISQKNPDMTPNQVISASAFAIYDNAIVWLRDAVKDFVDVNPKHMPKISLTDYLRGVTQAMTGIAEYRPRVHDANTFTTFNTLYSLLNMVAINAIAIQATKTTQNLSYCDEPSYNMAYAHLNDDTEIGDVTLPLAAIEGLPMRYNNENYSHQEIIVQIDSPDGVSPELVVKGMNYSFDTSCCCQHDCCGCVSNSITAEHLKGNFYLVHQSSSANW